MSGQKFPGCRVVVSGDLPGNEVVARVPEGGDLVGREALRAAGDGHRGRAEDLHLAERQHRLHASHHDRDVPAAKSVDQFIFRIDHLDLISLSLNRFRLLLSSSTKSFSQWSNGRRENLF